MAETPSDESVQEFNEGHVMEGCDRLHIITSMIDDHLSEHPAIVKAGAQDEINEVMTILSDVYQKVGELNDNNG